MASRNKISLHMYPFKWKSCISTTYKWPSFPSKGLWQNNHHVISVIIIIITILITNHVYNIHSRISSEELGDICKKLRTNITQPGTSWNDKWLYARAKYYEQPYAIKIISYNSIEQSMWTSKEYYQRLMFYQDYEPLIRYGNVKFQWL